MKDTHRVETLDDYKKFEAQHDCHKGITKAIKKLRKNSCNQCQKEMEGLLEFGISYGTIHIPVCTNPECPNFGLLQVSSEKIEEVEDNKRHHIKIKSKKVL